MEDKGKNGVENCSWGTCLEIDVMQNGLKSSPKMEIPSSGSTELWSPSSVHFHSSLLENSVTDT